MFRESPFYVNPGWAACIMFDPQDFDPVGPIKFEDIEFWLKDNVDSENYTLGLLDVEFKYQEDATLFLLKFS